MKNLFFSLFLFCLSHFSFSQIFEGVQADRLFKGSQAIRYDEGLKNPTFIQLTENAQPNYNDLQTWLRKAFSLDNNYSYSLLSTEKDNIGYTHYRFQQTYMNIPVREGRFNIHVKGNAVISFNGIIFSDIQLQNQVSLSENQALENALQYVNAKEYIWEIQGNENWLKEFTTNPMASYYPKGNTMILFHKESNLFEYVYKFDIYSTQPLNRQDVFIDATSGEVVKTLNTLHLGNANGTAVTKYSGTKPITTDSVSPTQFRLRETGRGNGIRTYNMLEQTNYASAVDFTDTDNYWNNVNTQIDEAATDAHWGAEKTYDYFFLTYGRNSIDNNGFALYSYIHYDANYANAFWDGQRMTYGDGSNNNPFCALDICAHEITHGLDSYTADLDYAQESGALNEGFSDIFGTAIEFYAKPTAANWTCGENIGMIIRNLQNPNAEQNPDTYLGTYWDPNQEVHQNSTVFSHWYYRVCQGGSGTNDIGNAFTVTGIGMTKASAIAWRMLTVYLTNTSNYADARFYSIKAATDLYGGCTPEVAAVTNAWYAVGIGSVYVPNVVAAFSGINTTNCSLPSTVQFQNLSSNATTYLWNFGDGSTSTLENPSHTYTTMGNFNVTLKGQSTGCGVDSIIQNSFVSISSSNSNYAIIPQSGSGTTLTCCKGTLFDSGENADYANGTDGRITIAPFGASSVTLTFTSFNFEQGYDYLYVYDGPTVTSPLIGKYDGSNLPNGGIIQSTGSQITLRQTTDQGVVESGFKLTWQCSLPSVPPVCNFSALETSTCSGLVHFQDVSINGPTSWLWNFGDGNTSTLQNPTHVYASNGIYTVKLMVNNAFGIDSVIKTNYIQIANLPTPPLTISDTNCAGGTATLSAAGSGILEWFDQAIGGNQVYIGTSYTTSVLNTSTTFYVQDKISGPSQYTGKTTNTGSGGYFGSTTNTHYLIFNCYTPMQLISAKVYAQGEKDRTIQLRDSNNNVLQTLTVNIPDGESRVTLNFSLPIGNKLQLVGAGDVDLFRNNNNSTTYPFLLANKISIIESSASKPPSNVFGNYYYFYDWEVKDQECISPRTPVVAHIIDCSGIEETNNMIQFSVFPNPATSNLEISYNNLLSDNFTLDILDILGKSILHENLGSNAGNNTKTIELSDISEGVYFVVLNSSGKKYIKKLIIQ